MSKKVELIVEIDSTGKITVTPKGTEGTECLELMAFLDKIDTLTVTETTPNEDMRKVNTNKVKNVNKNKNS